LDHWDHYVGNERIVYEVQKLVDSVDELLVGYQRMARENERLLLHNLDLPKELEQDFRLSRNLFSIGIDEVALFIAITLEMKGRKEAASESDLRDLIELMSKVRWKVKGTPLISKETKTLLQYIRTVRNSGAHLGGQGSETENSRQTASIIARTANALWNSVTGSRARLEPTNIQKNWG
jgi:hypothetical protein